MREEKLRVWKVGGAVIGVLLLGVAGYFFGRYGFSALDLGDNLREFKDPDAAGGTFAWLLALAGIPAGASAGRVLGERYHVRRRRREWRERNPEQAAEVEAQKREAREEARRRKSRRRRRT
jgi:hypothetical protein